MVCFLEYVWRENNGCVADVYEVVYSGGKRFVDLAKEKMRSTTLRTFVEGKRRLGAA